jgi:hypothetical protein
MSILIFAAVVAAVGAIAEAVKDNGAKKRVTPR